MTTQHTGENGVTVAYRAELWRMADALRGSVDAAEYKHVVLGLIFLKYISDAFEEAYARLDAERDQGADPEDPDEYLAQSIFWVPPEARWSNLQSQARQPSIGRLVDDAMAAVERDNPALKDVLPKDYGRDALDKDRLGQVVDLVGNIKSRRRRSPGSRRAGAGVRVFFGAVRPGRRAQGRRGSTPRAPWSGCWWRCCNPTGAGSMTPAAAPRECSCSRWTSSAPTLRATATADGPERNLSIYGQESNYTTWRLARMNLAIRGIENDRIEFGDSFHNDQHPDLRADYILANPPFNVSDWGGERLRDDKRWEYGVPPVGNANFAWVQHFLHHLAPRGIAGFVLANGSMSSGQSNEGEIRKNIVEAGLVDCIIALPGQLFRSTQIPACLWFLRKDRGAGETQPGATLFIDARKLGHMTDRTHRDLSAADIARVADAYHAWRGGDDAGDYADAPGFCKSATLEEIRKHGHVLTPGRYVGAEPQPDDGEPFADKMARLSAQWREQQAEAQRLDAAIADNLATLGFG